MIVWGLPGALLGLLLLPVVWWWRRRQERAAAVPYPHLQYARRGRRGRGLEWLRQLLELLMLALLIVALAQPHRERRVELLDDPGIDVLLVLDVSLSMMAEDFAPDRLTALRDTAGAFLDRSAGHRVGIAIFAGEPFLQCPLTTDRAILAHLLDGVTPYAVNQNQSAGTALGDALLFGVDYLARHRVESPEGPRDQAVVLITDGDSNQGLDPIVAARYAREEAVAVHLIGIGGPEPVEVFFEGKPVGGGDSPYLAVLDDAALSAVAAAADGRYYRAVDGDALDDVFAELSRLESAPLEKRVVEHRRFATSWLALGLFPLFVGYVGLVGFVLRRPLR